MTVSRRSLLRRGGLALGALASAELDAPAQERFPDLKSMTAGVKPLANSDFEGRIENARRLMAANTINAFYIGPGSSLEYFAGMRWGLSERVFGVIVGARGELAYVCPKFEEGRAREQIRIGADVRTWEEHESPYEKVRGILKGWRVASGTVGIEPGVREFVADGLRKACPAAKVVNGEAISQGCRMIKSAKELAYMALACEITQKAYDAAFRTAREGMTQGELQRAIAAAHTRLGATGGGFVLFGPNAAFPHGTRNDRQLQKGDVILVDGGCRVEGYESDVTRTVVFGKPSDRIRRVWDIVKRAQEAALAAARPGALCEAVDAAARKVIVDAGFGPDYKYFTHRVGHGIGLDGHEHPYLVRGNRLPLEVGMTCSDEPGIYLVGEFGVRIEDVMEIAENGARLFGTPVATLESY